MNRFSKLAAAAVPALTLLFTGAASAQQAPAPECKETRYLESELRAFTGDHLAEQSPPINQGAWTGMRIYADPEDTSWTVVAIPNDALKQRLGVPPSVDVSCKLAQGEVGYPQIIHTQNWYKQIFRAPRP